jgi:hypothetical protein
VIWEIILRVHLSAPPELAPPKLGERSTGGKCAASWCADWMWRPRKSQAILIWPRPLCERQLSNMNLRTGQDGLSSLVTRLARLSRSTATRDMLTRSRPPRWPFA